MDLRDLIVEVRDVNLVRRGQIEPEFLSLTADVVDMGVGAWSVTLPAEHRLAPVLQAPGSGLIITHADPAVGVLLSGPRDTPTNQASVEDPGGTVTVTGVSDDVILWNRAAYPTPTQADVSLQADSHDVRTGAAETVMRYYVGANLGPSAPVGRRVLGMTLAADQGRGVTVTRSARFDIVGDLLADIGTASGLGFRVVQVADHLEFQVIGRRDRTGRVRLDVWNGTLSGHSASSTPPRVTRVIVMGQGEGKDRVIRERADAAAEAAWGPFGRIERVIDQRQTELTDELDQAGDKALQEGAAAVAIKAVPSDDLTMRYPTDWRCGDLVTVVVQGEEPSAIVTSVRLSANRDGVKVAAGIGDVTGWTPTAALEYQVDRAAQRISALERNAEAAAPDPRGGRLAGEVIPWAGAGLPPGWLWCDGSTVSRTTYADLYAALGGSASPWGQGDGTTTFTLPDMRDRFPIGASATKARADTGGAATHTLTAAEMPSHEHAVSGVGISGSPFTSGVTGAAANESGTATANRYHMANGTAQIKAQATGGGDAHNNMPPWVALPWIIRT